jgi:hypothetical protein
VTRAERKAAEASYRALLVRVRRLAASASRGAIRDIDRVTAEVIAGLNRIATSGEVLSAGKANEMIRKLRAGLDKIERAWLDTATAAPKQIVTGIVNQYRTVHFRVAAIAETKTGGIAVRLSTVPTKTGAAVQRALRGRGVTPGTLIRSHVRDIDRAFAAYIESATGVMPSARALEGMKRLLRGDLPFDLGGVTKAEARVAASLPWKIERLISTESFETYRQGQKEAQRAAPVRMVAKWELSERHEVPDECDKIANDDVGFGKGWYPPEEWPEAPHPNCQCGQGDIRFISGGE